MFSLQVSLWCSSELIVFLSEITKLSSTHSHTAAVPRGSSGNFCCFSVNGRPVQLWREIMSGSPQGLWTIFCRSSWNMKTAQRHFEFMGNCKQTHEYILTWFWDVPSCTTTLILIIDVFQLTRLLTLNLLLV